MQINGDQTSKDLLKKIRIKIMQLYKIKITTFDKNNGLTLKFEGYSDYLLGNHQLKDFKRINYELEDSVPMVRICLTEIPLNHIDKNFPPLHFLRQNQKFDFENVRNSSLFY